jgi:hypothetical protein
MSGSWRIHGFCDSLHYRGRAIGEYWRRRMRSNLLHRKTCPYLCFRAISAAEIARKQRYMLFSVKEAQVEEEDPFRGFLILVFFLI